jgi:hypothetical protein
MRRVRPLLFLALVCPGANALAQLIPWSEPPSFVAAFSPPVSVPASAERDRPRRRATTAKKPLAADIAVALPLSSLDESAIFETFTTPSSILLSNFGPDIGSGSVRAGTTWVGNVTQHATSITVAGTAADDNGWGASGLSLNASGQSYLTITAQRDAGNLAPTLFVQFEDRSSRTKVFSVSTSLFAEGTPTAVQIPLTGWTIDFGVNDIAAWSIGGGSVGTVAFRLTFDDLSFTTSAIPEPSTFGFLAGLAALGAVAYRRRRARLV